MHSLQVEQFFRGRSGVTERQTTDRQTDRHTPKKETWVSAGSPAHFFLPNFPIKCPSGTQGRVLGTVVLELLRMDVFLIAAVA